MGQQLRCLVRQFTLSYLMEVLLKLFSWFLLDCYFPENNIRYIAVQEQIDTENSDNSNNDYAPLNNFINEKYSRDLSKNIKRVYKIKQQAGEYMGGIPIFGYIKDPKDKHTGTDV